MSRRNRILDHQFAMKAKAIAALKADYHNWSEGRPHDECPAFQNEPPQLSKYQAYLRTDYWRIFRHSVITECGPRCQVCDKRLARPQLHHLSYERLGKERPSDVIIACDDCHRRFHGLPTIAEMRERFQLERGCVTCAPGAARGISTRGWEHAGKRSRGSS